MKTARKPALWLACLLGAGTLLAQSDGAGLTVAGLGDMEKLTKDEPIPASPHFWDATAKRLKLHGGRNEVVAGKLMLRAAADGFMQTLTQWTP
jgi:hypothetical protein